MASPLLPSVTTSIASFRPALFPSKSQTNCLVGNGRHWFAVGGSRLLLLPCKAKHGDHNNPSSKNQDEVTSSREGKFDRRDMLFGLGAGGLYGAAAAGLDLNRFALADPIPAPDINKCTLTTEDLKGLDCCPKKTDIIYNFQLPASPPAVLRTRPAAHNAAYHPEYVAKYRLAIELMKGLGEDDPRNFRNQANVHCAYCEGSYHYTMPTKHGIIDGILKEIQVHSSWLFYPFHRWYLYFYERILADLIHDPTFALPFWNWDAPDGMYMPAIFEDDPVLNPLYDANRNAKHRLPGTVLDLNYHGKDGNTKDDNTIINDNLRTMNSKMLSISSTDWCSFFGHPYRAGYQPNPGAGNIESIPHNTVHNWTGTDSSLPPYTGEDMGVFYSAGRDPIFFAHHANVDRMWYLWKNNFGGQDIEDTDWLDSSFLFYDEKQRLVRVTVRDSLDTTLLGYDYQCADIPWIDPAYKPTPRLPANKTEPQVYFAELSAKFPATLDSTISVEVARPEEVRNRSDVEKAKQEEVLVIRGIEFPANVPVKFDVYVNDDASSPSGPDKSEFAGSFVHVRHRHDHIIKTKLTLGITRLLEDLGAAKDDSVVVTLVPRNGEGKITIGGFSIELSPCV
ncbi:PREDICTED: polyphenol oxidase I, chloroplastic-like [Prunus mume]|uniref:Polyphenol oxidase I, chloroplastic-like n=1 Tax=Prunus mume TaxID=102107 RepID=A0ABM0NHU0_PRUMU|nr:PREDICTED: polyphenol oxidase I, chloroplastic-like [Prunus mume]